MTKQLVTGQGDFAVAICKALGISTEHTTSIVLRIDAREFVTVEVTKYVFDDSQDQLTAQLRKYELVEKQETA